MAPRARFGWQIKSNGMAGSSKDFGWKWKACGSAVHVSTLLGISTSFASNRAKMGRSKLIFAPVWGLEALSPQPFPHSPPYLPDGVYDKIGLFHLDVVLALSRNSMLRVREQSR